MCATDTTIHQLSVLDDVVDILRKRALCGTPSLGTIWRRQQQSAHQRALHRLHDVDNMAAGTYHMSIQELFAPATPPPATQHTEHMADTKPSVSRYECTDENAPYRDLILTHLLNDIQQTCEKLDIASDPNRWTTAQTIRWLEEMSRQFGLRPAHSVNLYAPGRVLAQWDHAEFVHRSPNAGDTLHAQLQIWKTAVELTTGGNSCSSNSHTSDQSTSLICDTPRVNTAVADHQHRPTPTLNPTLTDWLSQFDPHASAPTPPLVQHITTDAFTPLVTHSPSRTESDSGISELDLKSDYHQVAAAAAALELTSVTMVQSSFMNMYNHSAADMNNNHRMVSDTRTMFTEPAPNPTYTAPRPTLHTGNQHNIHLWQFLRELLDVNNTGDYSTVVRWLDRRMGTFKIENSHELARLWGARKNRCKMNYDKLSRSLRQYYKKGILRKTGQRQRLIYQFCAPYNTAV